MSKKIIAATLMLVALTTTAAANAALPASMAGKNTTATAKANANSNLPASQRLKSQKAAPKKVVKQTLPVSTMQGTNVQSMNGPVVSKNSAIFSTKERPATVSNINQNFYSGSKILKNRR